MTVENAAPLRTKPQPTGATRRRPAEVLGPVLVFVGVAYLAAFTSAGLAFLAERTATLLVLVLALQLFTGNSGVLSFAHGAFALLGGLTTGLLTMPAVIKANVLTDLLPALQAAHGPVWLSIPLAVVIGAAVAAGVGALLMRLNGLSAAIATFAVLMVADNVFFHATSVGPGPQVLPQVPVFPVVDAPIALAAVVIVVVYLLGTSRSGRLLRASREDLLAARALGTSVWRLRVAFFAASGGLAALAGAMYAHQAAAISVRDYYLDFTFLTLAMLIIGGAGSVWGAVVGTLVVTAISEALLRMEQGLHLGDLVITLPTGVRGALIPLAFVAMLLWRPQGLTQGREFRLPGGRARARGPHEGAPRRAPSDGAARDDRSPRGDSPERG
ncbi:branched-chain amino acid ABC transporter permease [Xylanimonas allomyrinae]|uniref:Branched-chain amino acid ABC transporter permease n=1 Tax=Xylanimonas allomyrinae TaxID=2509459 RepID=A0A4P6EL12_9MICO|nr:branched-chain amino acid ABC transporter permease [Xylanimonas allomyrinae]QAY62876.1 branched-chain amino acid ABC transporter permease [Xylanimonas allomyrinae]